MSKIIVAVTVLAGCLSTLPAQTIRGVVNAASLTPSAAPNGGIAQGSQVAILGTGLGPAEAVEAKEFPYPSTDGLGGVTVKIAVGGSSADAILISASERRVVAVLPSTVPTGAGQLTLSYDGKTATSPVTVVATNFGAFAITNTGSGPARAKNTADGSDITFAAPARPGQQVTLLGTGLGAVTGDEAGTAISDALSTEVDLYVGGKKATVVSKARAGAAPGVDQIVFEVPADVSGCFVSLAVAAGGKTGNFVTTSIAAEGACSDPGGFTPADFERINVQSEFSSGGVTISRSSQAIQTFETTSENASGSFYKIKLSGTVALQNFGGNPSVGSCVVSYFTADLSEISVENQILDAGPALTLTGPKGTKQLEKREGVYNATLSQVLPSIPGLPTLPGGSAPFLDPGEYTVTGPGGADVGSFSAKITLGPPLNWTNRNTVGNDGPNVIDRSKEAVFNWTGGRDSETVSIIGSSFLQNPQLIGIFRCLERATVGTFAVPAWVLSALPPAANSSLSLSLNSDPVRFSVSGVDTATLSTSSSSGRTITFR